MTSANSANSADLAELAFGDPDRIDHPALAGRRHRTPRDAWLAGVVLGAAGRYAAALSVLGPLTVGHDRGMASLAASTVASHRRQLGGHHDAARWDSFGLRLLAGTPEHPEALTDALLGLTADAIGLGDLERANRMLRAVHERGTITHWRSRIRAGWVTTELLLASGEHAAARAEAVSTHQYAASSPSRRHVTKSAMLRAACLVLDETECVRRIGVHLAEEALRTSLDRGFNSLVWPSALLLSDACPERKESLSSLAGRFLSSVIGYSDPRGGRVARRSPWMPQWLLHPGDLGSTPDTSEL